MGVSYRAVDSIARVDRAAWEHVRAACPPNAFMDPRFLAVVETTMAAVCRFWHVQFFDEAERPLACATLSSFSIDLAIVAGERTKKFVGVLRRPFRKFLYLPVIFCGVPVSAGQTNVLLPATTEPGAILAALDEIATDLARRERIHLVVVKEVAEAERARFDGLLGRGYHRAETPVMHRFGRRFPDFAAYLAALRSHYRYDVERSTKKLAQSGLSVARLTAPDEIASAYDERAHGLYEAVVANSENQLEVLPRAFFLELARAFPGQVALTAIRDGERIVAFNWSLSTDDTYQYLFCGLDYAINREVDLYFNVMYAELDHALRAGAANVLLGQTSDTFKARLGCQPEARYVYAKGAGTLLGRLIALGFRVLLPKQPTPPVYDIWKKEPPPPKHGRQGGRARPGAT
jgi:predicted N-acyltransferase